MTSVLSNFSSSAPDPEVLLLTAERVLATDPGRTIRLAREAVESAPAGPAVTLRAQVLEGDALARLGSLEAAEGRLVGAAVQGVACPRHPLSARYFIALGWLYRGRGQAAQARDAFERAARAARGGQQPAWEAEALNGLAQEQHRAFDSRAALATLEQVLELRRRLGDPAGEAKTLCNQALILMAGRKLSGALERLTLALGKLGPGSPPETELHVRGNFGLLMEQLQQPEAAAEHYDRAREVAAALGDRHGSATNALNGGEVRRKLGHFDLAQSLLEEALESARALHAPEVEGAALHSLGLLASQQGDHDLAERALDAAEQVAQASGDLDGQLEVLLGRARTRVGRGQATQAVPLLERALALAQDGSRQQAELEAHLLLAEVHQSGAPHQAVVHLQAARALEHQLQDMTIARQVAQLTAQAGLETARRQTEHERQLRQISEAARRQAEATVRVQLEELERGRLYDDLTGLPNRLSLHAQLPQALDRARRKSQGLAVGVLDLDRFGQVNHSFGHAAGDDLLQQVATRIAGVLRQGDILARVGGDEFVLVLPDVGDPAALQGLAQRLLTELGREYILAGQEVVISTSLGLACFPQHGTSAAELQRAAASAMEQAKASGGGSEISSGGNEEGQAAFALESALFKALERDEFELHYQPLVLARDGTPVAAEALLRWNSPTLGRRPPGEFIPILERTGLIGPVGDWVLRAACRAAARWGDVRVAVNLSAWQFARHSDLVGTVTRALEESGLSAARLELEITESLMMQSPERAAQVLRDLKNVGVRVMLDDFGTGYSSLSYLRRFPLDGVKIDRSFVQPLGTPGKDQDGAIIRAIVQMCEALGLEVVAEGVETQDQHLRLLDLGVSVLQGYHFGRPSAQWNPTVTSR